MQVRDFFLYLTAVTGLLGGSFYIAAYAIPAIAVHRPMAPAVLSFFCLICIGLYFAGRSAAASANKHAFSTVVTASVFGKMALSIAFLFVYKAVAQPENAWFVGIFLFIYAAYTIFEVWFMTKLAR